MNYTYVPQGEGAPYEESACVVLTSKRDTQKFQNIEVNPNVSLLVHDWVTAKSMAESAGTGLAQLLKNLNQSEMSSLSATLTGTAKIISDDKEADFFREKHLENNPVDAKCFIKGDTVVILVKIESATVADVQNHVRTYENVE